MIRYETSVDLPRVAVPSGDARDIEQLTPWALANRADLVAELARAGAVLFRGFHVGAAESFQRFAAVFCPTLNPYIGGNSPRTRVSGMVFTTTEYPANQKISLHTEASYLRTMPRYIAFYCEVAPGTGGQTPLADSRRIYEEIRPSVRERFETKRVKYLNTLNAGRGLGRSWRTVFQTDDRAEVEKRLRADGYEFSWRPDGGLRTSIVADAVAVHPDTKERVWINQAEQWHPSSLNPQTRSAMASVLPETDFPHHACFGDDTPFEEADLAHIREVTDANERVFSWQQHDVLVCDNYVVMHGRQPFSGPRRILCAMG